MHVLASILLTLASARGEKPIPPELLAEARWVEGRVELPAGTPADERVEVVADALGLPRFDEHTVPLDEQGRFKVAFASDARRGRLHLRARYAFLDPEPTWKPGVPAAEYVLKPALGAWLVGRVATAVSGSRLGGTEVLLVGRPMRSGGRLLERTARLAADGSFEFGGLPCDYVWSGTIIAAAHQPLHVESIALEAGKRAEQTWTLRRGATVLGRVVDEEGRAVAGALVTFDCRSEPLAPLPPECADGQKTGPDGAFRAAGLYPGDVLVRADRMGSIATSIEVLAVKDGETRADVTIVLKKGLVLLGRVVDPEGAPVTGASVKVAQREPGFGEIVHDLVTDAAGTFTCTGLGPTPVRIQAHRTGPDRVMRVELLDVDPAVRDLVVRLVERHTLRGRVLDDLGRTMLRYTVGVRRVDPSDPNPKSRTIDVKGKDGLFLIDDLAAGQWEVFVYGVGIVFEPARRVEVPHDLDDLVFVVRRPAVVAGRVVDADGKPVARALVEVEWERPAMFGGGTMQEQTSVTASHEGDFEVTEIFPGRVRFTATSEDGRRSAASDLELSSGEKRAGLSLRITR